MGSRLFLPSDVPEVAAGYYWLARDALGLGTAGFVVPEGNGHSSFNLPQATVGAQPSQLTENGGVQFRMRKAADASPSSNLKTAAPVTAGWTGPTYVGMWVRVPDASGDITSPSNAFFWHHTTTAPNSRLVLAPASGTPDTLISTFSQNGTALGGARCVGWASAAWIWLEHIFDPLLLLGGSTKDDKLKWFINLSLQALTIPPTPDFTAINDSTATIGICCRLSTGNSNVDTTDWASAWYLPGIPSLAGRRALASVASPLTAADAPFLAAA